MRSTPSFVEGEEVMGSDGGAASHPSAESPVRKRSKRPNSESKFLQQALPACKPLLTPPWVVTIYMLIGAIFIPIGVFTLLASRRVVEIVYRYDNSCVPSQYLDKVSFIRDITANKTCIRNLTVPHHMKQPIFVYYELDNFYQNHRRYVKSRSDTQLLKGDKATDTKNCKPEQNLLNGSLITPCGLIAWSLFNDTYSFTTNRGAKNLPVRKDGIAWKSDREHKFGANVKPLNFPNNQNQSGVLIGGARLNLNRPLNEDEDLIVWMHTAALPNFRKLYGRIEEDLAANTIVTVNIQNLYNTYSFGGKKKLVLSTTTWIGGQNDFLGIAYIAVGGLSILLALVFLAVHLMNPRSLGDVQRLSWNKGEKKKEQGRQ